MVLRLAEHLDIPLRERNRLLLAAGYAPLYAERSLSEPEMTPVHQALDRFLRAHEPYPAIVIDRHHNLVSANDALGALTEGVAPELGVGRECGLATQAMQQMGTPLLQVEDPRCHSGGVKRDP